VKITYFSDDHARVILISNTENDYINAAYMPVSLSITWHVREGTWRK